jgi:Cys-tRNA(Pro)/Cys-tRNA(Cys) deacylase
MAKKLNSMRLLEQNDIPYEALTYPDSIHNAEEVAEVLGVPYFTVYKTLVIQPVDRPDIRHPYLVLVASVRRLDLKKMAAAAGVKKVQMASHDDAERMTGLKVGGISPLALTHKNWPVFLDHEATELQHICISAGERGTQLRVPVVPLVNLLRVRVADVSRE